MQFNKLAQNSKNCIRIFAFLMFFLFFPAALQAVTFFDGGGPEGRDGGEVTYNVWADDFVLSSDHTLTNVNFWTLENLAGVQGWDGTVEYFIFNNGQMKPGSVLENSIGVNVQKDPLGQVGTTNYLGFKYSFQLNQPINLTANTTYWLGLHLASDYVARDWIFWQDSDTAFGSVAFYADGGDFNTWQKSLALNPSSLAFNLGEDPTLVPIPSAVWLLGSGLIGFIGIRKKFKKFE